jgi:hemolysin activation/secretion protein
MCDFSFSLRVLAAAVAAGLCAVAAAQQRPEAGTILEQQKESLPLPAPSTPVIPQAVPIKPALPPSATLKVLVKDFRFSGNTVYPAEELRATVADFLGKTLDFDGLNDAAARVQRHYRDNGYFLAVAYLPRQQISNGTVEIAILEGRLGRVELQAPADSRLRPSFARGVLDAHLATGDLITEHGLERPLLLLRDLPGVDLTSALGPSKDYPGAADVSVKLRERESRFNGYLDLDNGGNRFTGEFRAGLNANIENLTGYGDLFSYRGFISDDDMTFGRAAYVIPVGYSGTRVGLSYTGFNYRLGKDFSALDAHGEGAVSTLYALHPFVRTRGANFLVQAAAEKKRLNDFIDSTGAAEHRKIKSTKLGAVGDFRDGALSGGLNSYAFTYTSGSLTLSPETLLAADAAVGTGLNTEGSFGKTNVDFRRLQRVSENVNLLLAYSAQSARKNLTASEKFSLGGPNGVRAYPVGEAPGDSGYLVSAELRYNIPKFALAGGEVTLSAFYDMGGVKSTRIPLATNVNNERSIAGAGFGLSIGREGAFLVKASLADRVENEKPIADSARRRPRAWFQAVKWF